MSSWLFLNKNALWLMKDNTNQFISKRSYDTSVNLPPDWWFKRGDPPSRMVVQLDGEDPQAYVPPINSVTPQSQTAKYIQERPFLYMSFSGEYDQFGFKRFVLRLVSEQKVADSLSIISGSPSTQKGQLPAPQDDFSGSGNPCPEGIYGVGKIIRMSAAEKGVGFSKIPIEVLNEFRVNSRSELLIHDDFNRQNARGSLGCLVTYNHADMQRIISWCQQVNRPNVLVVDYGRGLLKSKGIEISLGKNKSPVNPKQGLPTIPRPAIEIIKLFEGCSLSAYTDPLTNSKPITIGYGCTRKKDGSEYCLGDTVTQEEADDLLTWTLQEKFLPRLSDIPFWNDMNENQQSALISFSWNVGINWINSNAFKTINLAINYVKWNDVPSAFMLYINKGTSVESGLKRRRQAEGELWKKTAL